MRMCNNLFIEKHLFEKVVVCKVSAIFLSTQTVNLPILQKFISILKPDIYYNTFTVYFSHEVRMHMPQTRFFFMCEGAKR